MANKPNPVTSTQNIQWIIKNATRANLEKHTSSEKWLYSSRFNVNLGDDITTWSLSTYTDKEKEHLQFHLYKFKHQESIEFEVKFNVDIAGKNKLSFVKSSKDFTCWRWPQVIKLDRLFLEQNGYVDQLNQLILNCQITLTKVQPPVVPQKDDLNATNRLCDEYREFLNEEDFSDCSFTTSDKVQVPGHGIILTKRSPGFKKILEEMKAQKSKTRIFKNVNSETLKAVMSYIYTGNVTLSQNSTSVINVLKASIEFEIDDLKSLCIDTLIGQMRSVNVLALLQVAIDKKLAKLEAEALKYIMSWYNELKSTSRWIKLSPAIRGKIFDAFSGLVPNIKLESIL